METPRRQHRQQHPLLLPLLGALLSLARLEQVRYSDPALKNHVSSLSLGLHVHSFWRFFVKKLSFRWPQSVWNTPGSSKEYGEQNTKIHRRYLKRIVNHPFWVNIHYFSKYLRNKYE